MYKTDNLPLASYLYSQKDKGVKFLGTDKENPNRVSFMFEPQGSAETLANEYYAGEGSVSPLDYFNSYKTLKDIVFETKRNKTHQP